MFHPDTQTRAKRVFQFLERKVAQGALDPFMLDVYHVAKAVMSQGLVDHANNMLHGNYEKEEKTSG